MEIFLNTVQFEDEKEPKSYISRNIKCPESWIEPFVSLSYVHSSVFVMYIQTDPLTSNGQQ